jgi:DNA-binding NarL/FixJ family response regulator
MSRTVTVMPFIPRPRRDPLHELTVREEEILSLIARGHSNSAICAELHLSAKTVETHVRSVYQKLRLTQCPDSHRRVMAVLVYLAAQAERRRAA